MAFLEDPRLRQRWNQITHDAEAVTENAAAGIWSFQHNYVNPCFGAVANSIDQCTTLCLGDPDERLRRRRERQRQAEYTFDFYDDWDAEEEGGGGGGLLGSWGGDDWDRLLAGTGSQRRHGGGETADQPRRKRGMSYGTRGTRRKTGEQDPTIIPRTQPIGFLSKLPWKMGGTLRYKPSAADLQDRPGKDMAGESAPLLGADDGLDHGEVRVTRKRSGTTGSGDTSDSYRSRGDLFPSDGEGEEDAVPLDDEVTFDMVKRDDRSSGKTRSSKGKRPANAFSGSRTVSRTTVGSPTSTSGDSAPIRRASGSLPPTPDVEHVPSLHDLEMEEARLRHDEDEEVARKKRAASQLAAERGLPADPPALHLVSEPKLEIAEDEVYRPESLAEQIPPEAVRDDDDDGDGEHEVSDVAGQGSASRDDETRPSDAEAFVPARLPNFR